MSEMNMEMNNKCPGCGRHCDLSSPGCPRGEAFARGEGHDRPEPMGERHHHGFHGEHGGRGPHGEAHGKHPRPVGREEYDALDTDGKLGVLLHELHHMSRLGPGSRGGQGRILKLLAQEGDMTQRDLTEKLGIQPGSASEVIGKLERAGLVARSENAEDRRTADIRLTDAGRERAEEKEREKPELFSALSEEEKTQLLALLEKLRADWHSRFHKERGRE